MIAAKQEQQESPHELTAMPPPNTTYVLLTLGNFFGFSSGENPPNSGITISRRPLNSLCISDIQIEVIASDSGALVNDCSTPVWPVDAMLNLCPALELEFGMGGGKEAISSPICKSLVSNNNISVLSRINRDVVKKSSKVSYRSSINNV